MLTIPEEGVKIPTNEVTVGDREIVIKQMPNGYYYIDVVGKGDKPQVCEQMFTSLHFAKQGLNLWLAQNAAAYNKKKLIEDVVARSNERDGKRKTKQTLPDVR